MIASQTSSSSSDHRQDQVRIIGEVVTRPSPQKKSNLPQSSHRQIKERNQDTFQEIEDLGLSTDNESIIITDEDQNQQSSIRNSSFSSINHENQEALFRHNQNTTANQFRAAIQRQGGERVIINRNEIPSIQDVNRNRIQKQLGLPHCRPGSKVDRGHKEKVTAQREQKSSEILKPSEGPPSPFSGDSIK